MAINLYCVLQIVTSWRCWKVKTCEHLKDSGLPIPHFSLTHTHSPSLCNFKINFATCFTKAERQLDIALFGGSSLSIRIKETHNKNKKNK